MNPSRTPPTSDRIRSARQSVTRPRRLATLASVGAAFAMVLGMSVPAAAAIDPSPSPIDSSPSPTEPDPLSYWDNGNNVGVITYLDLSKDPMGTATGVFEVLGYPAEGEAGVVTVRADFIIDVEPQYEAYAMWHAPWQGRFMVGTHATATRSAGDYLIPTQHLYTYIDPFTEQRSDRTYGWMKFQVGEDWDREVSVSLVGTWHAPQTGKVATPVEEGFDGITVELLSSEETVYDHLIEYSVKVTVDGAVVGAPGDTRYQVSVYPGSSQQSIPAAGGSVVMNGTIAEPTGGARLSVGVIAQTRYGSYMYALRSQKIDLGYVNTPASVDLSLNEWYEDDAGVWWEATIVTHSLTGAAGEVCFFAYSSCRATVYAVTDTGLTYIMASQIGVAQRRGDWSTTVTNIGGTALPKRNYVEVFARIWGQPAYGVNGIVDSLHIPVHPWGPGDVRLRALEVNQAVQTWENDVPLVARKHTIVRAFLEIEDESLAEPVYGRLHGERNGVALAGSPLTPMNRTRYIVPSSDATSDRGDFESSLDFDVPDSWTTGGDVRLWLESGATELICGPAAGNTDKDCSVTLGFASAPVPHVAYFGLAAQPDFTTDENWCTISSTSPLHEQNARVEGLYPVPWIGHSAEVLPASFLTFGPDWATSDFEYAPCPPNLTKSNLYLKELRLQRGCTAESGCDTTYVMVLAEDKGGLASGIPADVATSSMGDTQGKSSWGYARNRTPHELGHTLGLWHAVGGGFWVTSSCDGAKTMPFTPRHPYMGTISYGPTTKTDAPLLGPQGDPATEVWGLDTRMSVLHDSSLAVMSPYENGALMGYCRVGAPQARWVSAYEYDLLAEAIDARFGGNETVARSLAGTTESGNFILASGVISGYDTPEASIEFDSVSAVTGEFAQDPGSDYAIRVWDGTELVGEVPFTPDVDTHDIVDGATGETGDEPPTATFVVPVLVNDAAYTRIEVLKAGAVIDGVNASAHAPGLSRVSAAVKDVDGVTSLVVDWRASDADGDVLTAKVRLTADGGATWKVLSVQVPGPSTAIPVSQLGEAADGRVEVQVSDGMLVSNSVASGKFMIADVAPRLDGIEGLGSGAVASGGNAVWARAAATDVEDGRLEGDALVWRSNLDGVVAHGPELMFDATTRTEGLHLMSVTATDSAGNTTTATDYLYVRHASEYIPLPDVTPGDLFGMLDQSLADMDLHPGVRNPLDAAAADALKEWSRGRIDKTCSALERFTKIVDLRDGDRNGLTSVDAGILRGTATLVAKEAGCAGE